MAENEVTVYKIVDNSGKVLSEFEKKVQLALSAIGATAQRYAAENCPVDTGRLRNSITWATRTEKGTGESDPKAEPEQTSVYIGSNVEYAPYVEYRELNHKTGKAHFLKDAASQHGTEYKNLAKKAMED